MLSRKIGLLLLLVSLLTSAHAATYTLPSGVGSGPFAGCTFSSPTVSCPGNVAFGNNDDLVISQAITLTIGGNFSTGQNADINNPATNPLTITLGGSFTVVNGATVNANITAGGSINFGNNADVTGDLNAGSTINFGNTPTVNGTCTGTNPTDYNPVCSGNSNSAAFFELSETSNWNGTPGEIIDQTGIFTTASQIGTAQIVSDANASSCLAGSIPQNTTLVDAIDTGVDINDDIGNEGTILFWYKANTASSTKTLFDASSVVPGPDRYFYLAYDSSNRLRIGMEDDADRDYTATSGAVSNITDWHHIAVGWDLPGDTVQVWVDGTRVINSSFNFTGNFGDLFTLYFGDNRSSYVVGSNSQNSANGLFDNIRFENTMLTTADVSTDFALPRTCATLPTPVIEYRFDELAWAGVADEVFDSSGNSNHATADLASGTTTTNDAVLCEAASFNGVDQFITATDLSALRGTATMSFWIKTTQTGNTTAWSSPGVTGIEEAGGGDDIFWGWLDNTGNIGITVGNDNSAKSTMDIDNDVYHHVVLIRDAAADTYRILIDGQLRGSGSYSGDGIADTITNVFTSIGRVEDTGGSLEYLDALVDEFIVFDQVLTDSEAQDIYTLQSTGRNLDGTTRMCNVAPGVINPLAWFSLDEIAAGQYPDNNGSSFSLDTTGAATAIDASLGRICAATDIDANNSQSVIDALNSNVNASADLGDTGAVSFWFNSDNNWNGYSGSRILFDASTSSDFFTLQLDSSGRLEFAFEDNSGDDFRFRTNATGFTANNWHHISLNWDLPNQQVDFYIDGAIVTSTSVGAGWGSYGSLPTLNNLIFGDARDNNSYNNVVRSANGRIDEIYVFDTAITASEALTVYNETHACPIQPISYHQFEETTWTGAADEVKDETTNGLDLTNDGNLANLTAGRVCTGAFFDGVQGRMSRANDPVLDDYSAGLGGTLWINPSEIPPSGNHTLINKVDIFGLRLTPAGEIRLNYFDGSGTSQILTTAGANIVTNSWTHIGYSVSPTVQRVWIDGVLWIDNSAATTLIGTSTGVFQIGANTSAPSASTYAGRIDELRIYNEPITQTEVSRDLLATHACDTSLVGWYQMEEASYNGTAGEVIDFSGNRNNGFSEGATARDPGYICFGANIPQNNSQAIREGIESGVDADNDLGTQGTIMLWYNSAENWNTGRRRLLIDASTDTSDPGSANNKFFFLSIEGNGRLRFDFEDSLHDDDFRVEEPTPAVRAAGDWHHIAITWDYSSVLAVPANNTNFRIYVDGVLVADDVLRLNGGSEGANINGMPNLQRVHFGDNASNYNYVPDASANGTIDEMRLYNRILTGAEIVTASAESHPCAGQAIVRYRFEESSWNGSPDEIKDDSGFNYDAVQVGTVNPVLYTSTCRAAFFTNDDASPASINAIATPMDIDRDIGNEGSIMMWLKPQQNWGAFPVERNVFDGSRNPRNFYGSILPTGELTYVVTDASSNQFTLSSPPQTFTSDDWVHVAFTWSFASQRLNLYINGAQVDTQIMSGVFNIADLPTLYLGDSQNNRSVGAGTSNSWDGWMEDARIYNYERSAGEVLTDYTSFTPCVELMNHFDIDDVAPANQAINCQPEDITISAKLADNSTAVSFTGTVTLSTSTNNGDWSYSGSAAHNFSAGAADSGSATIDFVVADAGVLTGLSLRNTHPELVNINVDFSPTVSERSGSAIPIEDDPDITFAPSGLQISLLSAPNTPIASLNVTAGLTSDALLLRAITTSPSTGVCTALFTSGTDVDFTLGTTCSNPSTCAANQKVTFSNNAASNLLANPENQEAGLSTETVGIRFGGNSTAEFTVNSPDIGTQPLNFSYQLTDLSGNPTELLSTSMTLQSSPATLSIVQIDGTDTGSFVSGSAFKKAGEDFNVAIEALDSNGLPVASLGRITGLHDLSFANSTLNGPSGGNFPGVIGNTVANQWLGSDTTGDGNEQRLIMNAAAPGYTGLTYAEVGNINLQASIANFMGYGTTVNSADVNVGRFTPAYLTVTEVNPNTAAWGSDVSQYQGQGDDLTGIAYDIVARDVNGNPLINYVGSYVNFGGNSDVIAKPTGNNAQGNSFSTTGGNLSSGNLNWTIDDDIDGDSDPYNDGLRVSGDALNLNWSRNASGVTENDALQTITQLQLLASALTDADNICVKTSDADLTCLDQTLDIADRSLYYGRVSLPEQVDADDQTAYLAATLEYLTGLDGTGEPLFATQSTENGNLITGLTYTAGDTCSLTTCPSAGALPGVTVTGPNGSGTNLSNGLGLIEFALTGTDSGILEVQADIPSWLFWDWDDDAATIDEASRSVLLFGEYQGNSPILFMRPGFR